MPLWIGSQDAEDLLDEDALVRAVGSGFQEWTNAPPSPRRFHTSLAGIPRAADGTEVMILVPGTLPSVPAFTVKVHAKYPDNPIHGRAAIQGLIHLVDAENGTLLALIDSPPLTAHRTAAAGAVAANALARQDARTVAIVGAGTQGEMQFRYLTRVRPIDRIWVFDSDPGVAEAYANRRQAEGYPCAVAPSLSGAVQEADIIITSTWSRTPFLTASMVSPGTHVTTLGPDSPGKVEVDADLLEAAHVVCDDVGLAREMGCLHPWPSRSFAPVSLTAVLRGEVPGRCDPLQRTVFGSVGLPFQDLAAAWLVYQAAQRAGRGQNLS